MVTYFNASSTHRLLHRYVVPFLEVADFYLFTLTYLATATSYKISLHDKYLHIRGFTASEGKKGGADVVCKRYQTKVQLQ
jgi:hypothetical protein